jgi:hypothetical protein
LRLSGNQLKGQLPGSYSALVNLEKLTLDSNRLTSTLPASWSTLHKLTSLSLGNNTGIQGTVPLQWSTIADYTDMTLNADYTYVSPSQSAAPACCMLITIAALAVLLQCINGPAAALMSLYRVPRAAGVLPEGEVILDSGRPQRSKRSIQAVCENKEHAQH